MEEDIRDFKNFIEFSKDTGVMGYQTGPYEERIDMLTFENILNELDRLQKENEKLKDKFILEKVAKEEIEELLADSIPKSVIQDKIEELNKEKCDMRYDKYDIQEILKELLNKGE